MTAEKYVDSISRKVKCSKSKRVEIKQQLLSDISAALENGETLEQVMERMGSIRDVAKEFNQNLPETEFKAYVKRKRMKMITITVAVLAVILYGVYWLLPKNMEIGSSGAFEQSMVEEQVKQVITELDSNDFETLRAGSTEAVQNVLSLKIMEDVRAKIGDDWGEFRSFGNIYMSEIRQRGQLYAAAQTTASYENVSVTYTILFDEDMKLAGLYMK